MASPNSTLPNDEKEAQDSHYNPGEQKYREGMGAGNVGAGLDQLEAFANDPANHGSQEPPDSAAGIRDAEDKGDWNTRLSSSYGGTKSKAGRQLSAMNVRAILKKRGPLGLIAVLGLGGGLFGAALFSPGIVLVQMKEALTDRFNTQLASMDSRSTKLLNTKLSSTKATTGVCSSIITIKCKFSTISEKQAARLKDAGIEVTGDSTKIGNRIKPKNFHITSTGEDLSASDFAIRSKTDPGIRSMYNKSFSPKYAGFADKIWDNVADRLGITKQRALPDGDKDAKTKALDNEVKNGKPIDISEDGVTCDTDNNCTRKDASGNEVELTDEEKTARQAAIKASQEAVDEGADSTANEALSDIEGGVKPGMNAVSGFLKVTGVADTACQAYSSVRALGYAAKTIRAIQLARYAMVFVNTADQIKAGTAKPEDVAYLGGILTDVAYDVKSGVKRKAAMDSAGMQYSLYGGTSGFKGQGASYISQFMAGGGLTGDLISITDYINSTLNPLGGAKNACKTLSNGWVQAGSLVAGLVLMIIPGVDVVVTAGDIAKGALSIAAGIGMTILPDLLKGIVAGNVTQGLVGEDSGNAIASGFGVIASDTAQAGGNAPMSVADAVAYTNLNNETIARYTSDEAKTLSPLDPSNKDTFVGSIVNKLLPFVSSTGSIGNPLLTFSSVFSSSLSSILPAASALSTEQTKDAYSSCTDPDYQDLGIATDPFCNPVFGIPTQYLDKDPLQVADDLTGQYNEVTGEPVEGSDYSNYVKNCINRTDPLGSGGIDGSGDDGSECTITSSNADYYLFYMDQRIDTDMDGYDSTDDTSDTASATIDQAHVYDDSTSVACAAGTDDAGVTQGYRNGTEIDVRLCSVPNTVDLSHNNQPIQVNSRISGATLAITQALSAFKNESPLRVSDSFRSMEEQQAAYAEYGSPRAAEPGYSNHQMGLAIDFQLGSNDGATRPGDPVYDWLVSNAATYGFGKISSEAWHWQAMGADGSISM